VRKGPLAIERRAAMRVNSASFLRKVREKGLEVDGPREIYPSVEFVPRIILERLLLLLVL